MFTPTPFSLSLPHVSALQACFFLFAFLLATVEPRTVSSHAFLFTPPACNNGQLVSPDQLPVSCLDRWFIIPNEREGTAHATRSPKSRAVFQFQGSDVKWFSVFVDAAGGSADLIVDHTWAGRVRLSSSNTGPRSPTWSATNLAPHTVHNLTILPVGDGIVTIDFLTVDSSAFDAGSTSLSPRLLQNAAVVSSSAHDSAADRDAASGAVIALASLVAVGLVVAVCWTCSFLGKRRKSPGFHMPTVLVDIESALDRDESPSPTTINIWREEESEHRSSVASSSTGHQFQYPPHGHTNSRPPSYDSSKIPYMHPDSAEHRWR
ncbi:hypothetical protein BU17DRAFT_93356 [Hysterangium stoloniferum]|nr:hypothetical protein BU17DRAFT_93356 [Hysterangium stoloniferum]